jgi:hypothetical protein
MNMLERNSCTDSVVYPDPNTNILTLTSALAEITDRFAYPDPNTDIRYGALADTGYGTPAQQRICRAKGLGYHARKLQRQAEKIRKIERARDSLARQVVRREAMIAADEAVYAQMVKNLQYFGTL